VLILDAAFQNKAFALNRATADFIISSPHMQSEYQRRVLGFEDYLNRFGEQKSMMKS